MIVSIFLHNRCPQQYPVDQSLQKAFLVLQDRARHTDFWESFPGEASWHTIQVTFLLACNMHK